MRLRSWSETQDSFTLYLRAIGKAHNTVRTYVSPVSLFWRWCEEREAYAPQADRETVQRWILHRVDTVSNPNAHKSLAALRMFFAWLVEEHERDDDPTVRIKVKRGQRQPTKPLRISDFDQLKAACNCDRDLLIILLLGHTGLRISELAGIKPSDCDWTRGLIRIRGKGNKEAYVAPPRDLMDRLHIFLGLMPPEEPIWHSKYFNQPMNAWQVTKVIQAVGVKAGIHVHPHQLRAMFATECYRNFKDIERLRRLMRHADISTTQGYIAHLDDEAGYEQMRALKLGA